MYINYLSAVNFIFIKRSNITKRHNFETSSLNFNSWAVIKLCFSSDRSNHTILTGFNWLFPHFLSFEILEGWGLNIKKYILSFRKFTEMWQLFGVEKELRLKFISHQFNFFKHLLFLSVRMFWVFFICDNKYWRIPPSSNPRSHVNHQADHIPHSIWGDDVKTDALPAPQPAYQVSA